MRHRLLLPALLLTAAILSSCGGRKAYVKYRHTQLSGWEKLDALAFDVPAMKRGGGYDMTLGMRINKDFPFMSLTLIIEHEILPSHVTASDTLQCRLIDEHGKPESNGISYHQYVFPVRRLNLSEGDSLHITVHHNMKREVMQGIGDVGIMLSEN